MKSLTISAALLVLAGCTTQTNKPTDDAKAMTQTAEKAPATVSDADSNFVAMYDAGNASAAALHYSPDSIWYLTNGAPITGRDAITAFLTKAKSDGAGNFEFSELRVREVGDYRYTTESFAFDFAPGTTVKGTRFSLWSETDGEVQVLRDAWVPEGAASAATVAEITSSTDALASAYNGGDAGALQELYTDDASVVLSNGMVISGDGLRPMLKDTAAMGIKDMRFGPQTVHAAGAEHAYSLGSFDVTLPVPDGDVPLAGERLLLWRKSNGSWKVVLELSWPRSASAKKTATLEAGGVTFSWSFRDNQLIGKLHAPTRGWVAVGFNDRDALAGSRLIMARVRDGEALVEEHYADPPNHQDIRSLGAGSTILHATGSENGGTVVEFVLDPEVVGPSNLKLVSGDEYWITLAFSEDDDFQHHSRFRTAQRARL